MSVEKGQFETDAPEIVSQENLKESVEGRGEGAETGDVSDKDPVKYATYRKLLNQHKNTRSELDELRAFKQQKEEEEALAKGEFDKILRAREEQIAELKGKLDSIDRDMTDGQKLQAFLDRVPGKIKRQEYMSFVDLESIAINPDTGKIDEVSLEREVGKFVKEFPDLIQPASGKTLPQVGSIGASRPNVKKSLKTMSDSELSNAFLNGQFKN